MNSALRGGLERWFASIWLEASLELLMETHA